MQKEFLVTGASGFAGSHQVDQLIQDHSVVSQVRENSDLSNLAEASTSPNLTLAKLDLRNIRAVEALFEEYEFQTVFHFAALSNVSQALINPQETIENNLGSTLNVLRAALRFTPNATIILTGSSHEYGIPDKDYPNGMDEATPLNPQNPYATSKVMENIMMQAFAEKGLRIVKARAFNHSGPRRGSNFNDGRLAKEAIEAKLAKNKWIVTVGNKNQARDWQHVSNWNNANLALAAQGATGETYNVASGQPHSLGQFIDALAQETGVQYEIVEDMALLRPGDPLFTFGNNEKLRSIGWIPEKSFEEMIRDSASYWNEKLKD